MRLGLFKTPLILAICLMLGSCASKKTTQLDPRDSLAQKEPSPLDPLNLPKMKVTGLSPDELVLEARKVEISVEGYPMEEGWQGFEVAINDQEPRRLYKSPSTFEIPVENLRKGANLIKVYLVRAWGESLKIPEAFTAVPFFFGSKTGLSWVAPNRPILSLVSPRGTYKGDAAKKLLFDFIVQTPDKVQKIHKVHYTLNGKKLGLESGKSYSFYNFVPGDYELRVEVVNARGIPLGQEVTRSRSVFKIVE